MAYFLHRQSFRNIITFLTDPVYLETNQLTFGNVRVNSKLPKILCVNNLAGFKCHQQKRRGYILVCFIPLLTKMDLQNTGRYRPERAEKKEQTKTRR